MVKLPEYIEKKAWTQAYPEGIPEDINIPETNMAAYARECAEEFLERTAIIFKGEKFTYAKLLDLTDRFANALTDIGIGKGDSVAILMANSPEWVVTYRGAMETGAIVTGISPLFVPSEIMYQVNDSEAKTIVLHERYYPNLEKVLEDTDLENVIVAKLEGGTPNVEEGGDVYHLRNLVEEHGAELPDVNISPDDVAVLQYSGGTTGRPKGCMLTHRNIVANVLMNCAVYDYVSEKEGQEILTALSVLPWYHIYGQTCEVNTASVRGMKGVVIPEFDPVEVMESIQEYECQMFLGVPTMFKLLADHPKFEEYDLNSLVWVISGAAPLPKEIYRKFKEVHGITITQGYGLSETSPVTHIDIPLEEPRGKFKRFTVGLPCPKTLSGIIDPETKEFLPPEEFGQLVVSGPQVMKGYWKRPDMTEEAFFTAGGRRWLRTGDLAFMDEEGFTYVRDRVDNMINYKGHSVFPAEVEDVFFEHPAVNDIAVIGVPDREIGGENIKAYIVLNEGFKGEVTEEEMVEYGKENLAKYKYPRYVEFIEEIPKTDAGKYIKRKLRDKEIFGEDIGVTAF